MSGRMYWVVYTHIRKPRTLMEGLHCPGERRFKDCSPMFRTLDEVAAWKEEASKTLKSPFFVGIESYAPPGPEHPGIGRAASYEPHGGMQNGDTDAHIMYGNNCY